MGYLDPWQNKIKVDDFLKLARQRELKPGRFKCEMCKGVYDLYPPGWSHEQAVEEGESKGLNISQCENVCDNCYKLTPLG